MPSPPRLVREPSKAVVRELNDLSVLNHAQAIEAPAVGRPILGVDKIVRPIGGDKDDLGADRHHAQVFFEALQAEQIAADGARRE